ncbi:GNAT family N-acetyltransferase [Actinomadura parmotrematis]|uniref:GNAT family N-acetyltransferase n=1 Tax=Actinomadura parmotrematis TaxID=2864039 RepID=A0ABS7FS58_9ACTN|nr:GNAT family N-acetyltransferase [Actinomadura parmotrematis]MBW8483245.1 GNAT family N-acetyltransferase [Actinomadura parmotrematis]
MNGDARALQERAARALPAEQVEHRDGWWLRLAPAASWWIGTVLPHGGGTPDDLARRVEDAERFYGRHGLAARFQITPSACPEPLDALPVSLDDRPSDAWLATWQAVGGEDLDAYLTMLVRVPSPSVHASAVAGGEVVAIGRGVLDDGWAGVFDLATLPAHRGKGAGRAVLGALAGWAMACEAESMYLQVERENAAALRLYGNTGFTETCRYHYRVAATPPVSGPTL